MSYDRVLPKPPALHYDSSQVSLSRPTSNLLEHKIMNDDIAMVDRGDVTAPSYRYSDGLPQVHLSSLNRTKIALNKVTATAAPVDASKSAAALTTKSLPLRERGSVSERSSSSSPVKSAPSGPRESVTQFCLCQPDPKIPRPRNAFILYRQHYQAAVVAQNPGLANPEISKIIGEQWRKLPQATKDEWKALAEEEKARHQQQYPEYRYQPRRYGRDGNSRSLSSGISHNPPGSTACARCGGRVMNPPASPDTVFPANGAPANTRTETLTFRSYSCRGETDRAPKPIKLGSNGEARPARLRQWEETIPQSPGSKRRRFNPQMPFKTDLRDKSPESPYPASPYPPRSESQNARGISQVLQASRGLRHMKEQAAPDPSLKLPPLQTPASASGSVTPITPFPQEGSSLEATVMTIPFLNKIKLLAKISPPLPHTFREGDPRRRGAVIAVDGQDPLLVKATLEYLYAALQKEGKFNPRIFEGPEIQPRESYSEPGQMGDATVDYLDTISSWHRISDEIKSFVQSGSSRASLEPASGNEAVSPGVSPRTIIPKTAEMRISSPTHSSENGSESASCFTEATSIAPLPVALVPRYQLTTADAFSCSVPINDAYTPLDHWQWMASLWRACVGPDVTVYIRECEKAEMERFAGNPVEIRLRDAQTVVVRRPANSPKELEEKVLKRVGFEVEDYLTQ
ncbi:hypothetical protein ARAM_004135 [Aspergillus rambellii]|uniref:HMG box domain-containing protein n=2 Tax=Aspergillus subgen. Nidulantes TaxID=2720870 RepID=A0A0F8WP34_9EURO|nr:hypothetical protein ARAM_004135 [Aspergillus rambellii]KKK21957.1 hypothetical protein AOCH_006238 [Aspergillus ochraceoroseus]